MRIALLTRWNATCGVSLHAEMLGQELIRMGNDLIVFAPDKESADRWWHHRIVREDEDFVIRCYNELNPDTMRGGGIDIDRIMSEDFDFMLVESYISIPYRDVEILVRELRRKGRYVGLVVHEGAKEDMGYSSLDIFDFVAVFDERYREMLRGYGGSIRIIPYPCYPVEEGYRDFGSDKIIFFSFGRQPEGEYLDFVHALSELKDGYDLRYVIVRSDGLLNLKGDWIEQKQERIKDTEEVYKYLHQSDIHLLPKGHTNKVVVSSTLCQCLGSLTPIVAPNTRHFEMLPEDGPALLYRDVDDLKRKLRELIEDEDLRERIRRNAIRYVEDNRADKVARMFLDTMNDISLLQYA